MDIRLDEQVAIVTGSGQGLGRSEGVASSASQDGIDLHRVAWASCGSHVGVYRRACAVGGAFTSAIVDGSDEIVQRSGGRAADKDAVGAGIGDERGRDRCAIGPRCLCE